MNIHAFSGFSENNNIVKSRTAGILAGLLETYPDMTWDDVLSWANENGIPDWVPNIDTDDSQKDRLIGGEYSVMFDTRYPWTSEAQSNFVSWAKGYDIGKLPPIETASPAVQEVFVQSQPAPQQNSWFSEPVPQPVAELDDWDNFQNQNADTTLPQSQPTPTPIYSQSAAPAPVVTPQPTPVPYPKPSAAPGKEGSSNMFLIVGGIIAAYLIMKRKK